MIALSLDKIPQDIKNENKLKYQNKKEQSIIHRIENSAVSISICQ